MLSLSTQKNSSPEDGQVGRAFITATLVALASKFKRPNSKSERRHSQSRRRRREQMPHKVEEKEDKCFIESFKDNERPIVIGISDLTVDIGWLHHYAPIVSRLSEGLRKSVKAYRTQLILKHQDSDQSLPVTQERFWPWQREIGIQLKEILNEYLELANKDYGLNYHVLSEALLDFIRIKEKNSTIYKVLGYSKLWGFRASKLNSLYYSSISLLSEESRKATPTHYHYDGYYYDRSIPYGKMGTPVILTDAVKYSEWKQRIIDEKFLPVVSVLMLGDSQYEGGIYADPPQVEHRHVWKWTNYDDECDFAKMVFDWICLIMICAACLYRDNADKEKPDKIVEEPKRVRWFDNADKEKPDKIVEEPKRVRWFGRDSRVHENIKVSSSSTTYQPFSSPEMCRIM